MKTIEIYEKMGTTELQNLLRSYEKKSEDNELLIDLAKSRNISSVDLQRENNDYEIDIRLIHRELNRRLWYGDF